VHESDIARQRRHPPRLRVTRIANKHLARALSPSDRVTQELEIASHAPSRR
jgi:hypothetical protein